jgi:glycosyltransferase involved in cell wall biosynthesis
MKRIKKIVILNGNHLCHNPRVIKEADSLAAGGFDVEVLGAWLNEELIARDRDLMKRQRFRYTPAVQLGVGRSLGGTLLRGRRWLAWKAKRWWGWESPEILGYGVRTLLRAARTRGADLYIAHSEPALWVARELARDGRSIGVDMEDWFSEDLPPEARRNRPLKLLRELEMSVLMASAHSTCTSQAMAAALVAAYGCREPLAIYNAFPWADRETMDGELKDRRHRDLPSIHWYSQSIGPGRGLEDLFAALRLLDIKAEVHLRGNLWHGYREWLDRLIPESWRERVFFHAIVPNDELLSRIAEHDIGVSLDPSEPQSRNVTVTNKILQYMQAGLAVVATSTLGQREVAAQAPAAVRLCRPRNAADLAQQLLYLLTAPTVLDEAKRASLAAARDRFCWEKVAPLLVASVERALASHS